ncbi:MAG: aminotransferase class III-fold pyridoxal phosphate-dependent enzyme [bacterium]|nr:aminotransferase class III-fold pyridoxal phosphate-dependent enzyme [bacterium]MCY3925647.1 aminotransferase class III-fold pyridoxal phosphate-dependent enzyme [bacterium]
MPDYRERASRHLLPHFTRGDAWSAGDLVVIERGEGCYVWDTEGNEYLDGLAGLFCTNLGHGRGDLTAAAAKQMDKLAFYPNWGFAHPSAVEAASMIAAVAPGDLDRVFFVNSGSEAVESALKFARCYHLANGEEQRHKVIARHWAYHGTTLGALTLTGVPNLREPYAPMLVDGVRHVPNTLGCRLDAATSARELPCVTAVEEAITAEGPETVAMLIAEPVQNGRGALVPPAGYWQELRRICDDYGVLLCADEVINAFGRLGHWFGSQRFGARPDMITFAKGVTSAYQPLAGVVVRGPLLERVWDSPAGTFLHGATFGGHPVATAVAVANMAALRDEDILGGVLDNEARLGDGLRALMQAHSCVKDVRGTGYFYALELMRDRGSGTELSDAESAELLPGGVLGRLVREARVLVRPDGRGAVMLSVSPPLVADAAVIDDLLSRLDGALDRLDGWLQR